MKVVILAGGYGVRISEETDKKPKPMIEIGGKPIIWHIMKTYSFYGFNDFIICAGYKQYYIKEWFANYFLHNSDVTFDFSGGENKTIIHEQHVEPWRVTVVDTGLDTMTGGRIKRIEPYIDDETFLLTYGDAVCDVNIGKLVDYHFQHGKTGTLTSVTLNTQKGILGVSENNTVKEFREKSSSDATLINAGYMVLNRAVFELLLDDSTIFEKYPLEMLAKRGELMSYNHTGYWQCMDTLREKMILEDLWTNGTAPWKVWEK